MVNDKEREAFRAWFYSEPHRQKYYSEHPAYLAAQEAWQAATERARQQDALQQMTDEAQKLGLYAPQEPPHNPIPAADWLAEHMRLVDAMLDTTDDSYDDWRITHSTLAARKAVEDSARHLAPQAEPVAWYDPVNTDPGQAVTFDKAKRRGWPHIYSTPLYTHPPHQFPLPGGRWCR